MKKNILCFLVLLLIYPGKIISQTSIIIGTDSLQTRFGPIYILNNTSITTNNWYLSIYDQSEITAEGGYPGDITGLSWFKTDSGGYIPNDATFEIYIKHTPYFEFASPVSYDDEIIGATLVYLDTTQSLSQATGWIDFPLQTPFHWNGIDNIMILTRWERVTLGTGLVEWQSTNTGVSRVSFTWNLCCSPGTYNLMNPRPNVKLHLAQQPSNDAGVMTLDSIRGRCPGNSNVYATIKNYGINIIDSVELNWEIDGVLQSPVYFSGNIPALSTPQVLLGNATFASGVSHSYKAWTINPNGTSDTTNSNDTIFISNLTAGLSGTYSIGTTGADFSSFSSAVSSLEQNGVCGPSEFLFDAGIYTEQVEIHEIPNASISNEIVFRSNNNDSTSVIIEWPASSEPDSNYAVQLVGAKYITFKSITFSRPDTNAFSTVLELVQGTSHIEFLNNRFETVYRNLLGYPLGSQSGILNSGGIKWNDIIIRNNYFRGNANGIWLNGKLGDYSDSLIIENNVFESYYGAISLQYLDGTIINGNVIYRNDTSSTEQYYGIDLLYNRGAIEIQRNKLTTYTGSHGIRISNYDATTDRGLIANNFVQTGPNTGTGRGIYLSGSEHGLDLFNNSIHYTGIIDGRALQIGGLGVGDIRVMNNILSNTGGGLVLFVSGTADNVVSVSDNNCFFSTGTITISFSGIAISNLSDLWLYTGKDSNSVFANPNFASFNDLHTMAGPLSNSGSSLTGLLEDIDGDLRNLAHPDIGADEFLDIGIFESASGKHFKLFPNPAHTTITIDGSNVEAIDEITIIDLSGREVMKKSYRDKKIVLDVSKISKGFYLVKISHSGIFETERIVVN